MQTSLLKMVVIIDPVLALSYDIQPSHRVKASLVFGDFSQCILAFLSRRTGRYLGSHLPARRALWDARPGDTQRGLFGAEITWKQH